MDLLVELIIAGSAVSVGGAWLAWRKAAESWGRATDRVGLTVSERGGVEGRYAGRDVHLTRLPGLEGLLSVALSADWSPAWFAAAEGRSGPLGTLMARYPGLGEAVDALTRRLRSAEIRKGRLVLRLRDWPEGAAALQRCLDEAAAAAGELDEAMGTVAAAERARRQAWQDVLERSGLRCVTADRIEGSYRGCDVVVERTEQGPRVSAELGPDTPKGWRVRTSEDEESAPAVYPGLPPRVLMTTDQPERARRLWAHESIPRTLGRLFARHPGAVIELGRLWVPLPVWDVPEDGLFLALDPVADFIGELQRHTDWPQKRPPR